MDYSKPKVTIDLVEYQDLLASANGIEKKETPNTLMERVFMEVLKIGYNHRVDLVGEFNAGAQGTYVKLWVDHDPHTGNYSIKINAK